MEKRVNTRKTFTGTVVSDKMDKTRVVEIISMRPHAKYRKQVKFAARFKAHDEKNEAKAGDVVTIMETRPLSKLKRWIVVEVVRSGGYIEPLPLEGETA